MKVTDYVSLAMKKQGWSARQSVADALAVDKSLLSHWSYGRIPGWETTRRLAALAGVEERQALLDWAVWQSRGAAKATADRIIKALSAACILLALSLGFASMNSERSAQAT